jgi:hypothetical protein
MPSWDDLAGAGSVAEQLLVWGVLNQLLTVFLGPTLQVLQYDVQGAQQVTELSPADAASAVIRNFLTSDEGAAAAAKYGIDAARFSTMVSLSGDAPGPEQMAEALRRQLVPEDGTGAGSTSFVQGIAEGRLNDKWAPIIKGLAKIWPSPTDALEALLQGQLNQADATALYEKLGGDTQFFQVLFNTRGNAPTPMEALEMLNRGIISESGTGPDSTSYEQAFLEGPWRNKWLGPFRALGRYVPPPRTVTALIHSGSLTDAEAQAYFQDIGMSPELAAVYVHSAHATKSTVAKEISESTVLTLYESHGIDGPTATAHLTRLGYSAADVALILEAVDLKREVAAVASAVTRIGALYLAHKITRTGAKQALGALDVAQAHADHLLATWDAEKAANVRVLTPAQIVDAWEFAIIDQATATAELVNLGYTALDAWILLSNKAKAPLPDRPALSAAGPGVNP